MPERVAPFWSEGAWGEPFGGFHFVSVMQLAAIWNAQKLPRSLRVTRLGQQAWFATLDLIACQKSAQHGLRAKTRSAKTPEERKRTRHVLGQFDSSNITVAEIHEAIVGGGGECTVAEVQTQLNRLVKIGLLRRTRQRKIEVPKKLDDLAPELRVLTENTLDRMYSHAETSTRRNVAVPRLLLRAFAEGVAPSTLAVALAVLIRCMWRNKNTKCRPDGRCSSSFVTDVFEISKRSVTNGFSDLRKREIILFVEDPKPQVRQKDGRAIRINLRWQAPRVISSKPVENSSVATPLEEKSTAVATPRDVCPYCSNKEPSDKTQESASPESGFSISKGRKKKLPDPDIETIIAADFDVYERQDALYTQAKSAGYFDGVRWNDQPNDPGQPFTATQALFRELMEYARRVGREPARLFSHHLRRRVWPRLTCQDQYAASYRSSNRDSLAFEKAPPPPELGQLLGDVRGAQAFDREEQIEQSAKSRLIAEVRQHVGKRVALNGQSYRVGSHSLAIEGSSVTLKLDTLSELSLNRVLAFFAPAEEKEKAARLMAEFNERRKALRA